MWYIIHYISTTTKRKLRNDTDVTDYFACDNEYVSRPKSAIVKDINTANIRVTNTDIVSISAKAISTHL